MSERLSGAAYSAAELDDELRCVVLDQRLLPGEERYVVLRTSDEVARAIKDMLVRGAPAIGVCAAYGIVCAARGGEDLDAAAKTLIAARPTAVNLAWAVERMMRAPRSVDALAEEARAIHREDVASCRRIGAAGADLVPDGATILTHCNAGALATGGYGTALGVVRAAHAAKKRVRVLACETRPYMQGARLTAWELAKDGVPVEVITDSMAAHFMGSGAVQVAVVGADRIARNGDTANKIGTYGVACIAAAHGVPLLVAAPWSTVDEACANGAAIPIEERSPREITHFEFGGACAQVTPDGVSARNPSFDVTPGRLIAAIVTDRGVFRAPYDLSPRPGP